MTVGLEHELRYVVFQVEAHDGARPSWFEHMLPADARLREVILAVRADEAAHRDINHSFADQLT